MSVECPNCGFRPPFSAKPVLICEYCGSAIRDNLSKSEQNETGAETGEETGEVTWEEGDIPEEEEYVEPSPIPMPGWLKAIILIGFAGLLAALPIYNIIKSRNNEKMFTELYEQGSRHLTAKEYKEAVADLSQSLSYRRDAQAETKLNLANTLWISEQAFSAGMKNLASKDYRGAMGSFGKVAVDDTEHYSTARKKLEESKMLLAAQQLAKAKSLYAKKDYITAYTTLNEVLTLNPQHKEAFKLKNPYAAASQKQEAQKRIQAEARARDADSENVKLIWAKHRKTKKGTWIIGYDLVNKSKWTAFEISDIYPTWYYREHGMPNFEEMLSNSIRLLPVEGGPVIKPGQRVKVRVEIADYIYELAGQFRVEGAGNATAIVK